MTAMENMALWHERDISHSSVERIILPDSTSLLAYMTGKITWVVKNMKVRRKNLKRNLELTGGHIFSQHVLLMLVKKGLSREEAYLVVQRAAMRSMESDRTFMDHLADEEKLKEVCSQEELEEAFDLDNHFRRIDHIFKRTLGKKMKG
jgi:adenylosuccinate lyase